MVSVVDFDAFGNLTWGCVLEGDGSELARLTLGTNGGFAVAVIVSTKSYGAGGHDALITKINDNGVVEWSTVFGDTDEEKISGIANTSDGGFVTTGSTNGVEGEKLYVAKHNATGGISWIKGFYISTESHASNIGRAIYPTGDGSVIVVGETVIESNMQMLVLKVNETTGELAWAKALGGPDVEAATSVTIMDDGGMNVIGATFSYGGIQPFVVRLNETGDLWYAKTLGNGSVPQAAIVNMNQDITFVGNMFETIVVQRVICYLLDCWMVQRGIVVRWSTQQSRISQAWFGMIISP